MRHRQVRETLHRLRYRFWGPRPDEAGTCRACDRIVAPFQGIRSAGQVFCCEDHVMMREITFEEVWAW